MQKPIFNLTSGLSRLLPVVAIATFPMFGCPPSNLFHGRLIIINTSRNEIRSLSVINSHAGIEQVFEFRDVSDGQACLRDFRGDESIVVLGGLTISYEDQNGARRTRSVPFEGEIPDDCDDDFFIEIDENDQLHSGLLIYQNFRETYYASLKTHSLAGVIGLFLGWMIWCKRRGRAIQPGHPVKPVTPEV